VAPAEKGGAGTAIGAVIGFLGQLRGDVETPWKVKLEFHFSKEEGQKTKRG
jgi:hypothetical protein